MATAVLLLLLTWLSDATAQGTPVTAHYPPGQSGLRGASAPEPGFSYTNFSRFFTNLKVVSAGDAAADDLDELRYANISMFTLTTDWTILGLRYGAMAGVPFATGDLSSPTGESGFGLGDVLLTPLALYGKTPDFDGTFQFTVWTPSGHFSPGSARNRGTGFWSLVYSLGGVWYPGGDRAAWSVSALARFEQNFVQRGTGIHAGDDVVVDWGVGRVIPIEDHPLDLGVSGFAALQLTLQKGGSDEADSTRYRLFGVGPEASLALVGPLSVRLRAHFEFAAHDIVRGNNLWLIFNYRIPLSAS